MAASMMTAMTGKHPRRAGPTNTLALGVVDIHDVHPHSQCQ